MTSLKTENLAKPRQALLAGLSLGIGAIGFGQDWFCQFLQHRLGLTSLRSLDPGRTTLEGQVDL